MPLLTSLDEYDSAIVTIAIHAQLGLINTDPEQREAALRKIIDICETVDETVCQTLRYATGAEHIKLHETLLQAIELER